MQQEAQGFQSFVDTFYPRATHEQVTTLAQQYRSNPKQHDDAVHLRQYTVSEYGKNADKLTADELRTVANQYKYYQRRTDLGLDPVSIADATYDPTEHSDDWNEYMAQFYKKNKRLPHSYELQQVENELTDYTLKNEAVRNTRIAYNLLGMTSDDYAKAEVPTYEDTWTDMGFTYGNDDRDQLRKKMGLPPLAYLQTYNPDDEEDMARLGKGQESSKITTARSRQLLERNQQRQLREQEYNRVKAQERAAPYKEILNAPDLQERARRAAALENPTARQVQMNLSLDPHASIANPMTYAKANIDTLAEYDSFYPLAFMTDDEAMVYNYLLDKGGKEAAGEFADAIKPTLTARRAQSLAERDAEYAEKHPVIASAATVLQTMAEPVSTIGALGLAAMGEEIDPNDMTFDNSWSKQVMRGTVSRKISNAVENEALGDALSFLYNVGMSGADMIPSVAMAYAGVPAPFIMLYTGSKVAAPTMMDVKQRGGSNAQAIITGMLAGAAEAAFEKIGIDNIRFLKASNARGFKNAFLNTIKSMGAEGAEEVLTDFTNNLVDRWVNGDNSVHERAIREYRAQGMTLAEAQRRVFADEAAELAQSFGGGALMGGLFSGFNTASQAIQGRVSARNEKSVTAPFDQNTMAELAEKPSTLATAPQVADQEQFEQNVFTPPETDVDDNIIRQNSGVVPPDSQNTPPNSPGFSHGATAGEGGQTPTRQPNAPQTEPERIAQAAAPGVPVRHETQMMDIAQIATLPQETQRLLKASERLLNHTGYKLRVSDGIRALDVNGNLVGDSGGYHDRASKTIVVDANNKQDTMSRVMGHELTHALEGSGNAAAFELGVISAMQKMQSEDGSGRSRYDAELARYEATYNTQDKSILHKEMAADFAGEHMFSDPRTIQQLVREMDRPWVGRIINALQNLFQRTKGEKTLNAYVKKALDTWTDAWHDRLYAEVSESNGGKRLGPQHVLYNAQRRHDLNQYEASHRLDSGQGQASTQPGNGDVQHSIVRKDDGSYQVVVDRDILKGVPASERAKVVRQYVRDNLKGQMVRTLQDGVDISMPMGSDGISKLTYQGRHKSRQDPYQARLNAATHADELAQASQYLRTEDDAVLPDGTLKHGGLATQGFDKRSVEVVVPTYSADGVQTGSEVWTGVLSVAQNENGRVLYDVSQMKQKEESGYPKTVISGTETGQQGVTTSSTTNILPENDNVNPDQQSSLKLANTPNLAQMEAYAQEYGVMPPGEHPRNDFNGNRFAKGTSDDTRTRQLYRTAAEAPQFDAQQQDAVAARAIQEQYTPTTNAAAQDFADRILSNNGVEAGRAMVKEFSQNLQQAKDNQTAADYMALGMETFEQLMQDGRTTEALDVITDLATAATDAGQLLQAARILKRNSPAGTLMLLEKETAQQNRRIAQQWKIARRKGDPPQIELTPEQRAAFLKATPEQRSQIRQEVIKDLALQIPSTFMEKADAWRYTAMLANVSTHMRNTLANAAMYAVGEMKNGLGMGIEHIFVRNPQKRTKAIINPLNESDVALRDFANQSAKLNKKYLQGSGKEGMTSEIEQARKIFKNSLGNRIAKGNENLLEWEDWLGLRANYVSTLAQAAKARGYTAEYLQSNTQQARADLAEIETIAAQEARRNTFRSANRFSDAMNKIEGMNWFSKLVVGGVLPFKRTPMNIVMQGLRYSPAGVVQGIYEAIGPRKRGEVSAAQAIDRIASGLTGSGLAVLGGWLASAGFLTAGDDDDREGYYKQGLGEQGYSLNFGDHSYSIDWLSPAAMPLFVGAELYKMATEGLGEFSLTKAFQIIAQVTDPVFQTTMLQGLAQALSTYESGSASFTDLGMEAVNSYLGQFLPSQVNKIGKVFNRTRRTTYASKASWASKNMERRARGLANKIPGLSSTLEPFINVWGDPEYNSVGRAMMAAFGPGNYSRYAETPVDTELLRLGEATNESGVYPSNTTSSVTNAGEQLYFEPEEKTRYATTNGQTAYSALGNMIYSKPYKSASNDTKVDMVKKAYSYAAEVAKAELLKSRGIDYKPSKTMRIVEEAKAYGLDAGLVIALKHDVDNFDATDEDGNTVNGLKKQRQLEYLESLPLSPEQMEFLNGALFGSSTSTASQPKVRAGSLR